MFLGSSIVRSFFKWYGVIFKKKGDVSVFCIFCVLYFIIELISFLNIKRRNVFTQRKKKF